MVLVVTLEAPLTLNLSTIDLDLVRYKNIVWGHKFEPPSLELDLLICLLCPDGSMCAHFELLLISP